MKKRKISGTGVALITPFHKYGTIDFSSLEKIINHVIDGGVNYLVIMGTTGEYATLSNDEQIAVLDFVIEINDNRLPLVLGIGGNNTQEVMNKVKDTDFSHIDAILSVTPYYNKPSQKGLYYHFRTIANATSIPIILYNVPGRTSCNMTSETVVRLANECENIIAIKEASGDLNQVMEIFRTMPKRFEIISGDDALTLPMIAAGASGVISVIANAYPKEFSEVVSLCRKNNCRKAQENHYKLLEMINTIFEDGSPGGIKAALECLDLCKNYLRLPIVKVNKSVLNKISVLTEVLKTQFSEEQN